MNDADAKMGKSVEATREEFAAIRAGRANPAMFAKITADYYGTPTPLQQLASFTSQRVSSARCAATVSVEKNGMPAPAPKITTRPFSMWRIARRGM